MPASSARTVRIGDLEVANDRPLTLIAGPCQLEGLDHALAIAEVLAKACAATGTGLIFKSSYDKANRTSLGAQRGMGMDEGLKVLAAIRDRIGSPAARMMPSAIACQSRSNAWPSRVGQYSRRADR
jgi:2-dehydro-3-deoxyphosphooctonate aldolase (KDO 8-P synthase)